MVCFSHDGKLISNNRFPPLKEFFFVVNGTLRHVATLPFYLIERVRQEKMMCSSAQVASPRVQKMFQK